MSRVPAVALAFALAACSGSTGPTPIPAPGGTDIILELGQARQLGATGITVTLRSVDDSRCGTDVVCVWEGNARIALDFRDAGGPEISGELNTHPTLPRALTFRYLRIELTELEPLPNAARPIVGYRAHLHWSYLPD